MPVYVRYIDLNGCKNSYCIPEKPNGYALFMLLDYRLLTSDTAEQLIETFVKKGYTVFSSNLLLAEWGSKKAVKHAEHLIQLLLRQETINERIFLCAEGTGALIAQQLFHKEAIQIRAATFIQPFLSLQDCLHAYNKDELALKRFKKEMRSQYDLTQLNSASLKPIDERLFPPYTLPVLHFTENEIAEDEENKELLSEQSRIFSEMSCFYQAFIARDR
ncbi:hypothetical protein ABC345_13155 [Shouchella sp. 1P09AA]|uniref:hypothetical protein n=1 Tax=unclassified Shouchella TaxID=2893065 RepID=UPI00399F7FBF